MDTRLLRNRPGYTLAIEGFCVVEGIASFHADDRTVRAEAGTLIHLPRMVTRSPSRARRRPPGSARKVGSNCDGASQTRY
jgi:hypothetical protein